MSRPQGKSLLPEDKGLPKPALPGELIEQISLWLQIGSRLQQAVIERVPRRWALGSSSPYSLSTGHPVVGARE